MKLFYSDSTAAEKASVLLLLASVAVFLLCFFVDFRASDEFWRLSTIAATVLALAIPIAAWIVPPIRMPERSTTKKVLIWLLFLPLLWLAALVTFSTGVGYLSILLHGKPGYELADVAGKSDGSYARRGCRHWVLLTTRGVEPERIRKCVSKPLWRELGVGDTVSVTLERSSLGYSVRTVSRW